MIAIQLWDVTVGPVTWCHGPVAVSTFSSVRGTALCQNTTVTCSMGPGARGWGRSHDSQWRGAGMCSPGLTAESVSVGHPSSTGPGARRPGRPVRPTAMGGPGAFVTVFHTLPSPAPLEIRNKTSMGLTAGTGAPPYCPVAGSSVKYAAVDAPTRPSHITRIRFTALPFSSPNPASLHASTPRAEGAEKSRSDF